MGTVRAARGGGHCIVVIVQCIVYKISHLIYMYILYNTLIVTYTIHIVLKKSIIVLM